MWEPYVRLNRDAESATGGSGIGLSVVRELVTLHGGRTRVESAPGGGARVVIELPLTQPDSTSRRSDPSSSTRFRLHRATQGGPMTYSTLADAPIVDDRQHCHVTMPRILIVEDNPDLAYGLRTGLEIEGYEVQVAEDGETGLERARAWRPDLVMLDLMLPGMDGYRVLKTLREGGSDVPVLILTARGEEADKVLGFRLGADDYVTKPCGVLELLARVGALLRRSRIAEHRGAAGDGARAVRHGGDQPGVAHGDEGGHSSCTESEGVRSIAGARSAPRRGGVARRAAARGVGPPRRGHDADGGHPHRGAAPKARRRSVAAAPHSHGVEGGVPTRTVIRS